MRSTEAVFATVYDRYLALHTKTPQERYDDLMNQHPDLFRIFPLKDIASYLNITPTHVSRLRKHIEDWKSTFSTFVENKPRETL